MPAADGARMSFDEKLFDFCRASDYEGLVDEFGKRAKAYPSLIVALKDAYSTLLYLEGADNDHALACKSQATSRIHDVLRELGEDPNEA